MLVDACPERSQNQGNELLHRMGAAVWRVGFRCVLARTLPEPKQKHRFLHGPKANWRTPCGEGKAVEQVYKLRCSYVAT